MKPKLVIWGASGHARVVADIIRLEQSYEIVGFLDDHNPERARTEFCGALVLGGKEQLDVLLKHEVNHLIVGVGDCHARLRLASLAQANGFRLATGKHPRATIAGDVQIGDGTVIMAGAVINPGASVGKNVIVNTSASIDHDCVVADGVHIGPGARLAGNVVVERAAWIGMGAMIINGVRIGADAVIGAGSVVLRDIPDSVAAYGVPAKIIKRTTTNDE